MSTGASDRQARSQDPRARNVSSRDGISQVNGVSTAHIPHGGEARRQRIAGINGRPDQLALPGPKHAAIDMSRLLRTKVHVGIYETRQQRPVTKVNDLSVSRDGDLPAPPHNCDLIAV